METGGPLLDEHAEALEALRNLHHTLGELLAAIDHGKLDDEMGKVSLPNLVDTQFERPRRFNTIPLDLF